MAPAHQRSSNVPVRDKEMVEREWTDGHIRLSLSSASRVQSPQEQQRASKRTGGVAGRRSPWLRALFSSDELIWAREVAPEMSGLTEGKSGRQAVVPFLSLAL